MSKSPEVRLYDRARTDLYINKIIGDEPHLVRVRDISAGGLYLYKLLEPCQLGPGYVGLELKLPGNDDVIWAVGEVVRADGRNPAEGVAVRFVRIAEHDRQIIRNWVESHRHADDAQPRAA